MGNGIIAGLKRFAMNKNTVTIFAVLVGIVVLWVGYSYRVGQSTKSVEVWAAGATIKPVTKIDSTMLVRVKISETLAKIGAKPTSKELERDITILSIIESKKDILQKDDVERLLSLLSTPNEINDSLRRRTNEIASTIYCCAIGMYADGYHLFEYGTRPQLPYILSQLICVSVTNSPPSQ